MTKYCNEKTDWTGVVNLRFDSAYRLFAYLEDTEMMDYQTITAPVTVSYVEKKSEFLATLVPISTQAEAIETIESVRRNHRKARHHVYAYLLREWNISRYSDDGEPQGTAGTPVLDVLQKNGLTDVCCVVTRYFGGILLGANGLVRAYSHSASLAVESSKIQMMRLCYPVSIQMDYAIYGKISHILLQEDLIQQESVFAEQVTLQLLVRSTRLETLKQKLIDLTGNQIVINVGALQYADFSGK